MALTGLGLFESDQAADFLAALRKKKNSGRAHLLRKILLDCHAFSGWAAPCVERYFYVEPENAEALRSQDCAHLLIRVPRSALGHEVSTLQPSPTAENEYVDAIVSDDVPPFLEAVAASALIAMAVLPTTENGHSLPLLTSKEALELAPLAYSVVSEIVSSPMVKNYMGYDLDPNELEQWLDSVGSLREQLRAAC